MRIYNITSEADAHKILKDLLINSSTSFKIHISFGYVFINRTTGQIIANPQSNSFYFNKPQLIRFRSDMTKLLTKINAHSIKFKLDQDLPDTQSQLIGAYSMGVKIYDLGYPVGSTINLPNYILKSRKINSLNTVENNLCFWACCSLMCGCKKMLMLKNLKNYLSSFMVNIMLTTKDLTIFLNYLNSKIHLNLELI